MFENLHSLHIARPAPVSHCTLGVFDCANACVWFVTKTELTLRNWGWAICALA